MALLAQIAPDENILERRDVIIKQLIRLLGAEAVIADEFGRRAFETDALTAYKCMPLAVVMPETTEEVAQVLSFCNEHEIPVVARGAGTSVCGGALPQEDAIVLCISRMIKILDIDYDSRVARVQSGITNLAISDAVSKDGFFYAPDPSSQIACTLAGNIAMNSGGAHCLKYGVTTNNLLGAQIVMMDGEIIDIGGAYLDAPGYDFLGLLTGSEGQIAIVTEATVRILKAAEAARPILIGFNSVKDAGACVASIIASGILPVAIEFMDKPAIEVCEAHAHAGYPLDVEALLIVEVEGCENELADLQATVIDIAKKHGPTVIKASADDDQSAAIWRGRQAALGAMGRISDFYCMDGVIPVSRLPEVLERVFEICASYGLRVANIFHAGDGNLHPLILFDANNVDEANRAEQCGADILELCVQAGGCLTGEHGVGIEKRDLMPIQFNDVDLAQQMRIKTLFDPKWLLNPGKVFPLDKRNLS